LNSWERSFRDIKEKIVPVNKGSVTWDKNLFLRAGLSVRR
jgi:hypothetical protein